MKNSPKREFDLKSFLELFNWKMSDLLGRSDHRFIAIFHPFSGSFFEFENLFLRSAKLQ